jgi:Fels-1 Prophage Protein-like
MRLTALLCLALLCSGCGAPQVSIATGSRWAEPGPWPHAESDFWPARPGYGRSPFARPAVVCDRFGRCWQAGPFDDRLARSYVERRDGRPPGWAKRLPDSARTGDRFLRPRAALVCDRATRICYKRGGIDKSDTERMFGARAGDRADDLRDRLGSARVFVPERGVACDRERRTCVADGDPDRRLTRRYFGRQAARAIEPERSRDDGRNPGKRGKREKR